MAQNNYFESPFKGVPLNEQVTNPNIIVGKYSYYSGFYHGHSFDDCARYLCPDKEDVDKLIIGNFCSIGTGVSFVMVESSYAAPRAITDPYFVESVEVYQPLPAYYYRKTSPLGEMQTPLLSCRCQLSCLL